MSRGSENQHVKATPHFDGGKEDIINDPTASAGSTIGIQVDSKIEVSQERNPYNFVPKADPDMKRFEKLMRGNKEGE